MIITRTPYRLSFFGGGTDYPAWSRVEGGAVLSTSIDKYCYVSVRHLPPFFSNRHRVVWSHIETVSTIAEILHPAVREGLQALGFDDQRGLEIHHQGDLPARAGMGSSSAFAVALVQSLTALRGQMIDKHELATTAIRLEQDILRENVGSQDQVAVAYGGLNVIRFHPDGDFGVDPVTVAPSRVEELKSRLMLFYTGTSRLSSEIAAEVIANLPSRRDTLLRMRAMVDEAVELLSSAADLDRFGKMLDEAWQLKRGLAGRVSSDSIDGVYRRALRAGALGGKLLGAGGCGFMVFYVPEKRREAVLRALAGCLHVPFDFERDGSRVIHYGSSSEWGESPLRRELAARPALGRRSERAPNGARAGAGGS
jgi:D-glycero-alpha-D-manno-heptose-7-phosphate kinase